MDLDDLYRRHQLTLGMIGMGKHLPQVMADVAEDAQSHEEGCPRCDGVGTLSVGDITQECPDCKGRGRVQVPGDAHARRLLFQATRLIGRNKASLRTESVQQHLALIEASGTGFRPE